MGNNSLYLMTISHVRVSQSSVHLGCFENFVEFAGNLVTDPVAIDFCYSNLSCEFVLDKSSPLNECK